MEEDIKRFEKAFDRLLGIVVAIIVGVVICAMMSSCVTTKYVPIETVRTDTLYQAKVEHDSIHVVDSIFVNQYTKGDTVFREQVKWRTHYIEHTKTDTIHHTEVVGIEKPVVIERQLTWWQRICISYGHLMFWLSVAAVAVAAFVIIKRK